MADNKEFRYLIKFDSVADRTGSRNAVEDIRAVNTAVKQVSDSTRSWSANSSTVSDFLNRTRNEAQVTEIAFYDLDASLDRVAKTVDEVGAAPGAKVPKMGAAFQQASFQVQDFAVQVGAGTSALTAIGQQAPQFLGIFGPGGAIAGAVVAVGALVGNVLLNTKKDVEEAKESLLDFDEVAQGVADNAREARDKEARDRKRAVDLEIALNKPDTAGEEAKANAQAAQLNMTATLVQVAQYLNELMGRQVSATEQLLALEAERANARKFEEQQEIAAEERKVRAARDALDNATLQRNAQDLTLEKAREDLEQGRAKLENLREQKAMLEEIAKQTKIVTEGNPNMVLDVLGQPAQGTSFSVPTDAAKSAQAALRPDSNLALEIKAAEALVNDVENQMSGLRDSVFDLEDAVNVAARDLNRQTAATKIRIETITKESGVIELSDSAQTTAEIQKNAVSLARNALEQVQSSGTQLTDYQKKSAAALGKAIEDGVLTARELSDLGTNMQGIMGSYKGPIVDMQKVNDELMALVRVLIPRVLNMEKDLGSMRNMLSTPPPVR